MEKMGPYNRVKERVCTKERESVSVIKRGKRGSKRVYQRAVEKQIHPAIKVTTNSASILCRKKGWEEENGPEL